MKVLHVNTARDYRGGERQTMLLAVGLHRSGVESHVATPRGSALAAALRREGLPEELLHETPLSGEVNPVASVRLARICRRHAISTMHLHTAHAHALGVVAALGVPAARTVVARRVDYPRAPGLLSGLKYGRADAFVAISEAVRSILLLDGVPPDRIHLVRSGIRVPEAAEVEALRARQAELKAERGIPASTRVVLNVGNLVAHKGQAILPEAARLLAPDACILVAGDGPLRGPLEDAITRLGVADRVRLLGHCADVVPLYGMADVYVQPSTSEGLGTAMLDAMAYGIPVVATAAGGIPEAVRDGETGVLLHGRNPYLLGEAIRGLCRDGERARALGARGREVALAEFSDARMVRETMEVYGKLCRASG